MMAIVDRLGNSVSFFSVTIDEEKTLFYINKKTTL